MAKEVINIKGMTCPHCVNAVAEAIDELEGIKSHVIKLEKGTATVRYKESVVSLDEIKKAITEAGYAV